MKYCIYSIVLGILFSHQAFAYLSSGHRRLDHALYPSQLSKFVVAGTIESIQGKLPWEKYIQFHVHDMIFGDHALKETILSITLEAFEWPQVLHPLRENTFCILLLRQDAVKPNTFHIATVVPAQKQHFPLVHSQEQTHRMLVNALLTELAREQAVHRQRELILQLSPILTSQEAQVLRPFLKSDDIWLKRAALAGRVYATKTLQYVDIVQDDISRFIHMMNESTLNKDQQYHAYRKFFEYYFFFKVGWSRKREEQEVTPLLPLFRRIVTELQAPQYLQWEYGMKPLCRLGDEDDILTLWTYYHSERQGEKKDILENPYYRQMILMGLSRILHLGLSNWGGSDFIKHEEEQYQKVSTAIKKFYIRKK